jgi:hypothetical protein
MALDGNPGEIARALRRLASGIAYLSGRVIPLNGGL